MRLRFHSHRHQIQIRRIRQSERRHVTKEEMKVEQMCREILSFWKEIPDADREYICRNSSILSYPKGKHIYGCLKLCCAGAVPDIRKERKE